MKHPSQEEIFTLNALIGDIGCPWKDFSQGALNIGICLPIWGLPINASLAGGSSGCPLTSTAPKFSLLVFLKMLLCLRKRETFF